MKYEEALAALVELDARLGDEVATQRAEWSPEPVPATVEMGAVGRLIAAFAGDWNEETLDGFSEVVEKALLEGDELTGLAVTTGLLESAQGHAYRHRQPQSCRLFEHLGPRSREYCRAWDEFAGVRTPGL